MGTCLRASHQSLISASAPTSAGLKQKPQLKKLIVSGTEQNGADFAHLIEVRAERTGEIPTVCRPTELFL